MMPILMGVPGSVPHGLRDYQPMIDACALELGSTVYLTIHESFVAKGKTQRRGGIHTEAYKAADGRFGGGDDDGGGNFGGGKSIAWDGGWGGITAGVYMASTDGRCRIWDEARHDVDHHGGLEVSGPGVEMEPSTLYWITDRTPHESLPALRSGERQFFRLVSSEIGAWWSMHNTANPLGVLPRAPVIDGSKFGPSEVRG